MKSWLCASAIPACLLGFVAGAAAGTAGQDQPPRIHPANELVLAGLRPGKDTFAVAEKRFKSHLLHSPTKSEDDDPAADPPKDKPAEVKAKHEKGKDKLKIGDVREWLDDCHGRSLKLGLDSGGVIQSVTISSMVPQNGDCRDKSGDFLAPRNWMTGRGLRLGDPRDRILDLYGEPDSSGPSVKGKRELELLYYAFDWAGSDVPQVLEVSCERSTGKVLEITLAFPSL